MGALLDRWKEREAPRSRGPDALPCIAGPSIPHRAKLLLDLVLAYAMSPIDLIPDFVPVPGCVDDLVDIPTGIAAARRAIPTQVWDEARARVTAGVAFTGREKWLGTASVVAVWLLLLYRVLRLLRLV